MRLPTLASASILWSVAMLTVTVREALSADATAQDITPRYVVIDLGTKMLRPEKITDSNVMSGRDEKSVWYTWSDGTLTPQQQQQNAPSERATALRSLKLPQPAGAAIVPLKKVANVPSLWDRKGVPAAQESTTQVIGNGLGGAYLWEKEHGPNKNFGAPIPLNLLVPQDKVGMPWNITSVADINNGGTMVGNAIYTPTGTNDPISAGPHGVMILPMAIVRENPPGSGNFGPIVDNGLDEKAELPIYATESGKGMAMTIKSDKFLASIYGGVKGPVRSTMVFTLTTRFDTSDTGTLSETGAGSGVFEDKSTGVTVALNLPNQSQTAAGKINVVVRDPKLGMSGDAYTLVQIAPDSGKYRNTSVLAVVILKAPLSAIAINTLDSYVATDDVETDQQTFTETAVNSRIFKAPGGMIVAISGYMGVPGGKMNVAVSGGPFPDIPLTATLQETSATSLQYANDLRIIGDEPVSTPATDGQGIFYIEMTGTRPTKVTLGSAGNHVTVDAVPVKGRPNLLRTGKLVLIAKGDPFRAPDITTIEADGEVDLEMHQRTIVK